MEGYFGRQFFLQEGETVEHGRVVARDINEEVVIVESLKFDLDIRRLHDFVNLAVLLPRDELPMLVGKLHLEADLVVECLPFPSVHTPLWRVRK